MSIKNLAKISLGCIAILFGFALNVVYAAPGNQADTNTYDTINGGTHLSYMPRVYLDGAGGYSSGTLYLGEAKILQPVLMRYDRDLFLYGQGRFSNAQPSGTWSNSPWSGSLGIGYRQIMGQSVVLGGYVLGGYSKTPTDHSILFVNPGFEALGKVWEFRLNGYFPISKSKWDTSGWADNFGNNSYVMYTGHDEYDAMFTYHETAGMGADTQIGRKLFKLKNTLVKGYLEGYYFSEGSNNAVTGGGATISVQPYSYLKFSLTDTYDNYAHNTAMLGIEVSLYDLLSGNSKTTDDLDLQHRLFEPIQNNFAAVGSGNVIPTAGGPGRGKPDVKQYYPPSIPLYGVGQAMPLYPPAWSQHNTPERTNVWFFNAAANAGLAGGEFGTDENGTYEHPFTGSQLSQGEFNEAAQYGAASLYFAQGTYYANDGANPIILLPGESIYGRNSGGSNNPFLNAATSGNAANFNGPIFQGSFKMDSNTSLNYMQLRNYNNKFAQGITIDGATGVYIRYSQIGVNNSQGGYVTGILIKNNGLMSFESDLTLNDSDVYGYNNATGGNGVGIEVDNGVNTNITANNGTTVEGHSVYGNGIGLYVAKDANGNAKIGNLYGDATRSSKFLGQSDNAAGSEGAGYGLYADSTATTSIGNIDGLTFEGVDTGTGSAYGLYATSTASVGNSQTIIGNIDNSEFYAAADPSNNKAVAKNAAGLFATATNSATSGNAETSIGTISNSKFYGYGNEGYGYGLYAFSMSNSGKSATSIGGDLTNGKIESSYFRGSSSEQGYGLYASSQVMGGSASSNATTSISNIINSKFLGYGVTGASGLDAISVAPLGVSTTQFGNIEAESSFWGESVGTNTSGFNATALGSLGHSTLRIGVINHSYFSGDADVSGIAYGFEAKTGAKGTVYIKRVTGSVFTAEGSQYTANTGTAAVDFYIDAGGGAVKNSPNDGSIRIDTISGDTFNTVNTSGSGKLLESIGVILNGSGKATYLNGYQVLNGENIRKRITASTFNLADGLLDAKACKKGDCSY